MKDNFSTKSSEYAKFRPTYPRDLFTYLVQIVRENNRAWDCGTGNGQVAVQLAKYFQDVEATDISTQQIENAIKAPNISYSRQPAETTNFPDSSFDLITVAQAIHWFDFDKFYKEVQRTLKPDGIIAAIGYGLFRSNPETNVVIAHFYKNIIGPYWDPERNYLDEHYETIPFPFEEIQTPKFQIEVKWKITHLLGYLKTWSAVKHFQEKNKFNPVDRIAEELKIAFGKENSLYFPLFLRVGRKRN